MAVPSSKKYPVLYDGYVHCKSNSKGPGEYTVMQRGMVWFIVLTLSIQGVPPGAEAVKEAHGLLMKPKAAQVRVMLFDR